MVWILKPASVLWGWKYEAWREHPIQVCFHRRHKSDWHRPIFNRRCDVSKWSTQSVIFGQFPSIGGHVSEINEKRKSEYKTPLKHIPCLLWAYISVVCLFVSNAMPASVAILICVVKSPSLKWVNRSNVYTALNHLQNCLSMLLLYLKPNVCVFVQQTGQVITSLAC